MVLRNWRRTRDTREIVKHVESKETLARDWIVRLERVEKMLAEFENSAEFTLPKVYEELMERLEALENRPIDITPPADAPSEDVQMLAEAVMEAGETASRFTKNAAVLVKRMDASEGPRRTG